MSLHAEQTLYPEDFEAAEEAAKRLLFHSSARDQIIRRLAEQHARVGDRLFRLQRQLRRPRSSYETVIYNRFRHGMSGSEYGQLIDTADALPLEAADFAVLDEDLTDRLSQLRALLRAAGATTQPRRILDKDLLKEAEHHAREALSPLTMSVKRIENAEKYAESIRQRERLGIIKAKGYEATTAISFARLVIKEVAGEWQRVRREYQEGLKAPSPTFFSLPHSFLFRIQETTPRLSTPEFLLEQEISVCRSVLQGKQPTPGLEALVPMQQKATPIIEPRQPATKDEPSSSPASNSMPEEKVAVNFSEWAVAVEKTQSWWLYRLIREDWKCVGPQKIPKGDAETVMTLLAEGSGSLGRPAAKAAFKRVYPGRTSNNALSRTITDALAGAKEAIRKELADQLNLSWKQVGNPIPKDYTGWKSAIEIGLAVEIEGQLVFRRHDQLHVVP